MQLKRAWQCNKTIWQQGHFHTPAGCNALVCGKAAEAAAPEGNLQRSVIRTNWQLVKQGALACSSLEFEFRRIHNVHMCCGSMECLLDCGKLKCLQLAVKAPSSQHQCSELPLAAQPATAIVTCA